jgi:hypothetical protein
MYSPENLVNKGNPVSHDLINIMYLKDSKSGRIKKGAMSQVSKANANYLVKHGIAKII